jgi:beta-1,4-mannosyl-glycoprotein beta-1,4-N-acetylglucosaminyltransferase
MDPGTLKGTSVFDVFSYNGEPIVALRLETLAPVVDRFVIVESRETFSGIIKDRLWKDVHADVFAPYADKIEWIVLDSLGKGDPWAREAAQRNAPTDWLRQQAPPYIALICDVDEIVSPDVVVQAKAHVGLFHTPVCLTMDFFYYNFEWRKPSKWYHAYVVNHEMHVGGLTLDTLENTLDTMRLGPKDRAIPDAGWHCSYFETSAHIKRKIESFSHQEHNVPAITSIEHITKCIGSGVDLFNRGPSEDLVAHDVTGLPLPFQQFNWHIKNMQLT